MQLEGQLGILFHGLDQLGSLVRHQQACHILDTDGIRAHLLDLFSGACPVLQSIGIAQGIGQSDLRMSSSLFLFHPVGGVYRLLQVAQVIETVEDTDNVDTVGNGFLHERIHHIVRIRAISENILSAEQHLQLRIFEAVTQLSQPVPGILFQETQGSVKGSAAPALHGMVSYLIHLLHNGKHEIRGHSGSNQRLVSVTQYRFRNLDRFLCLF